MYRETLMMVCLIKKVKKPETNALPIMINMLMERVSLMESELTAGLRRNCSTAVREFPMRGGTNKEKILAMIVIKNPMISFHLYWSRNLFK